MNSEGYYSSSDIEEVKRQSDIRDQFLNLKGSGASRYCTCPKCGKSGKGKGLIVTHKKQGNKTIDMAKCFSCGYTINGAISARMELYGESFLEAVKKCADDIGYTLLSRKELREKKTGPMRGSFVERQLAASGLSFEDVEVKVPIKESDDFKIQYAFRKGGVDDKFTPNATDDEMLIFYYDLDGNPMRYASKGAAGKPRDYVRVRWSNPAMHKGRDGKEIKYETPKGAHTQFYIPQKIRDKYHSSETIETLIIQEGEKKAEKACKHGIPSIGIQGIFNIGNEESGLMKELQYIVERCKVKNVVLLMDSDWDHLSSSINSGDPVDMRPNTFSKAVIKFKTYLLTLHTLGLSVDVWWGHIKANEKGEKGIDDLLCGTLKCHEDELASDIDTAMHSHTGTGDYLDIHKITTLTDFQIRDFWMLNSKKDFFEKYKERLDQLKFFRFGRILYANEEGKIKEAVRSAADTNFWAVSINDTTGKKSVEFHTYEALEFLNANGFRRMSAGRPGEFMYVKVDDGIIRESSGSDIRDFVMDYVVQSTKDMLVRNKFASARCAWLGQDKIEGIKPIDIEYDIREKDVHKLFYKNGSFRVTAQGIEKQEMKENVWESAVINRNFYPTKIFEFLEPAGDSFEFNLTEDGSKCEFVRFVMNTCNFNRGREHLTTDKDEWDSRRHFVNKVTALGYLMCSYKYRTEAVAVIAMDAKLGEVADSNGRSGKSLFSEALKQMFRTTTIDGKNLKSNDSFVYSLVTPDTRVITFDDVLVNFDFTKYYQAISGDLQVNPKGRPMFEIPFGKSPKFYITTNHAINDTSDSGQDRMVKMAFSDYYSKRHKVVEDFGHRFFDDWDDEQWNLFDNFMAECVMYYLRSMAEEWDEPGRGVVKPPMEMIEKRQWRQVMGENFLEWAESYFDVGGSHLNNSISRKDITDAFHEKYRDAGRMTPVAFSRRMRAFCKYKGYHFNPNGKEWDSDESFATWQANGHSPKDVFIGRGVKSGSIEFWLISTPEYAQDMNQIW